MSRLKDALAYASIGFAVFPLTPGSKRPIAGSNGLKDATTDITQIGLWWGRQYPDANIGIATGERSGIVVLDVDVKHGASGAASLAALIAEHSTLPPTPEQTTPTGGTHYLFRYAPGVRNSAGKLGPGLDIRGDGGYIAAAPSITNDGVYAWRNLLDLDVMPIAPMPEWLLKLLRPATAKIAAEPVVGTIMDGSRNSTLASLAGTMRRRGMSEDAIREALFIENAEKCDPPLDETEVAEIAHSMMRYEPADPASGANTAVSPNIVVPARRLVPVSEVAMRPVPWLWPGYLPRGAVILVVGDPDCGKTLTTLDIAARVSTGREFPDGVPSNGQPGDVIILSAEDSTAYTIRPRLEAAEADVRRAHVLMTGEAGSDTRLSLAFDVDWIEGVLQAVGAKLVVVDPISAYLPGIDTYRDNEVRVALAPLVALAERQDVTVIGIVHMSKNVERTAMQRVLGSTAFTALSRAAYMVAKDPDDQDRRLVLPVKFNLGRRPGGLAFRPTPAVVETPEGQRITTVRAIWETDPVALTADEVLRRQTRGGTPGVEAESFIRRTLADGPVPAKEIESLAAGAGISDITLRRARERLGIQYLRDPADPHGGRYFWLPNWTPEQRSAWIETRRAQRTV